MEQRKIIIFEGISGSGKSTIEDKFRELNNYYHYTVHRLTASKWVYSKLYDRPIFITDLNSDEYALQKMFSVVLVLCDCDPHIAHQRKQQQGDLNVEINLSEARKHFLTYYNKITVLRQKLMIQTDRSPDITSLAKKVLDYVNIL